MTLTPPYSGAPTSPLSKFLADHPDLDEEIREFVKMEESFFRKTLSRARNATLEQRAMWRKETVFERRLRVSQEVFDLLNGTVAYGPLKGLQLLNDSWWGSPDKASMLLGLYEREVLETLLSTGCRQKSFFIDVGAADGYYAVGLARNLYYQKCFCFEINEKGRKTIKENALKNGVANKVEIFGAADSDLYKALPHECLSDAVMLIDVEGAEFSILNADFLYQFRRSYIVIEIHNWVEGFEEKYFSLLHAASKHFYISRLMPKVRDVTGFSELDDFTDDNRFLICSEGRPNVMRFLLLSPQTL